MKRGVISHPRPSWPKRRPCYFFFAAFFFGAAFFVAFFIA